MLKRRAKDIDELVELIANSSPLTDPSDQGPVIMEITLWDGRKVEGRYHKDEIQPHIQSRSDYLADIPHLKALVEHLIPTNYGPRAFITETGSGDDFCTLIWRLVK